MTKTKKRQILFMTIITVAIFTFLLWHTLDKEEPTILSTKDTTPAASSNEIIISRDGIVEFINNYNLYLVTNYSSNIEDLSNQEKLVLATTYLINQNNFDYKEGVDAAHYETYIHYVFGVDSDITNEDINYNGITIKYDEKENKYICAENLNKIEIVNILDKVTSYNNKKENYVVTIKSVFMKDKKVYGNITNLLNNRNVLLTDVKTVKFEENYYDEIEDSVTEVEYSLALEGKHLVLKDYKIVVED